MDTVSRLDLDLAKPEFGSGSVVVVFFMVLYSKYYLTFCTFLPKKKNSLTQ